MNLHQDITNKIKQYATNPDDEQLMIALLHDIAKGKSNAELHLLEDIEEIVREEGYEV